MGVLLGALLVAAFGRAATRPAPAPVHVRAAVPRLTGLPPLTALPPPLTPGGSAWRAVRTAQARTGGLTAHLARAAVLRDAPGGRQLGHVARRTGYGARRVYAVAAFAPGWVGVRSYLRPNGKLAWLPQGSVRLQRIHTTLVADLSDRELTVRVDGVVRQRAPIGIGRAGSETPLGTFGVTDRLEGSAAGLASVYGCCVVPTTAHQTKLPVGWTGGTRIAFHGTPDPGSVGQEVSAGCLRMRNEDLHRLLTSIPLGATVTIRE